VAQNRYMNRPNISTTGVVSQDSFIDEEFRGDYQGGINLIYKGFARPGSDTAAPIWQIAKLTYDANNNVTMVQWPVNSNGAVTNFYEFVWDDRTTLTFV
jgi:hypothetical protein